MKSFFAEETRQLAAKINFAAVGLFQPADHTQRRCLAATAGTEQGKKFAFGDLQVDVIDGDHAVESLVEILNA